jgi:hypothetical protein
MYVSHNHKKALMQKQINITIAHPCLPVAMSKKKNPPARMDNMQTPRLKILSIIHLMPQWNQ